MCHLHEHVFAGRTALAKENWKEKKNAIAKSKAPTRKETIFRSDRVYYYLLLYIRRGRALRSDVGTWTI